MPDRRQPAPDAVRHRRDIEGPTSTAGSGAAPNSSASGGAGIDRRELELLVDEIAFTAVKAKEHADLVTVDDEGELRAAFFVMQERFERVGWLADRISWRAGFPRHMGAAESWMLPRKAQIGQIKGQDHKSCGEEA